MNSAKKQKDKDYYLSGINMVLKGNETLDNYKDFWEEYKEAYSIRKKIIDDLYNEIKIIKKLKV